MLIVGLIKKILLLFKLMYFPEPYTRNKKIIKVELDFTNHKTESDLKNAIGVDTLYFAKRTYLARLKSDTDKLDIAKLEQGPSGLNSLQNKVDKLDVDKIKPVPSDFKRISDVAEKEFVKT